MLIKNFRNLARNRQRKLALQILNAGMEAVLVKNAIKRSISRDGDMLHIKEMTYKLSSFDKVFVVGFGKASIACAKEIEKILSDHINDGLVLDVSSAKLKKIKVKKCTHPVLSAGNVRNTKALISLLKKADKTDLIICFVSGGGSAILENPAIPLNDYIKMNKALLKSGAEIHEMNTIRKHMSKVKGGQLPLYANKATFVSIILSDVVGDDLSFIASGPTVADKTAAKDARKIIKKYKLPDVKLIETPSKLPENIHNFLILNNVMAVEAMKHEAEKLGLKAKILSTKETGEARIIGAYLAKQAKKGYALIAAGETTVTVKGNGKGGRNQEVALGALKNIGDAVVISAGTDGIDNTPAAGGIVDKTSLKKNPDYKKYLDDNNAFNYLKKTNDLIFTGKTGTNVADVMLVLKL
ncbi:MAG TPA: DUF4147 domain-containing protein [Candidatus Nanoarchaeia archaeon]|nr:DUF4147 domain-containing protein [Candidatus Nanoarchaeia archaeon]